MRRHRLSSARFFGPALVNRPTDRDPFRPTYERDDAADTVRRMAIDVRELTSADEEAFASLWQSAVHARRSDSGLTLPSRIGAGKPRLSRSEVFGAGVFDGVKLVSAAVAMPARADDGRSHRTVPGLAHVSSVATSSKQWGEGLAGMALRAVMWHAVRLGYARVQLWTQTTNLRAHTLYEREGFELSGREKALDAHDDGERIVHYIRELPSPRLVLGRRAARILCINADGQILLMHWRQPLTGRQLWEPPGGGIEPGETPRQAVLREWREETGLAAPTLVGEPTTVGRDVLWGDARFVGDEVFFFGRYDAGPRDVATAFTAVEQASYLGQEWIHWSDLAAEEWRGDLVDPDPLSALSRLDPGGPWSR